MAAERSRETLQSEVFALFRDKMNRKVADADFDLVESGILDSLAFVELLALLEAELEVTIEFENLKIDDFRTIASISDFVWRQRVA